MSNRVENDEYCSLFTFLFIVTSCDHYFHHLHLFSLSFSSSVSSSVFTDICCRVYLSFKCLSFLVCQFYLFHFLSYTEGFFKVDQMNFRYDMAFVKMTSVRPSESPCTPPVFTSEKYSDRLVGEKRG